MHSLRRKVSRLSRVQRTLRRLIRRRRSTSLKGRLLLTKKVTLLTALVNSRKLRSTVAATAAITKAAARARITPALLRRKRYRYKKLTYLFLKARRLH